MTVAKTTDGVLEITDELETSLGYIGISNPTGNLWLQQEIDAFFKKLKEKY